MSVWCVKTFNKMKKNKLDQNIFERKIAVSSEFLDVPLIGLVRASDPAATAAGDYDLGDIISNFQHNQAESITLQATDNAMRNAGILCNDHLTIDLRGRFQDGDIVVLKLGERIFIRKYYKQSDSFRFETADDYPSLLVIKNNTPGFEIIGKVISVTREF